ncbi:related to microfibril-associated protein [Sporisorium reilianum f. sp. reilianum]|uniref:Related to microfibril-associated protein n=1 Tax=Sporisorium reilianum f. sp. reilianum TaxID=72559 RepID=A0A2N8UKX1_9BASI|nr:related to microfibril-associated protein [Sporisorium reilianum f. sp. reilianum]
MAPPATQKQASGVARPAARYRPGKAPLGAGASLDDYSDSDDASDGGHERGHDHDAGTIGIADLTSGTAALLNAAGQQQRRTAAIILHDTGSGSKKLDLRLHSASQPATGEQEDESSEYETDTDDEPSKPVFRKPGTSASVPQQATQASDSSEYETDSEEEESDEEPAPQPMLKPVFVPKRARTTISSSAAASEAPEADAEAKAEALAAARRKEAHDLAAATIKRQLAEKEHADSHPTDVDDTDGLDPDAEFDAWRQRELARLQRDRDALVAQRAEQAELERFRALPEAEKERLGRERAAQQQAEKKKHRGNPAFLQKYYHKGSFFQDMDILKRDYTEKTTKDVDVSKLPKMMQVRNYGVKGRSKWTHLANEDTSKAAMRLDGRAGEGSRGCFRCGGAHLRKDCPEAEGGEGGGSGANRAQLASGERGERSRTWGQTTGKEDEERSSHRRRSRSPRRDSSRYDRDEPSRHSHSTRDDRDRHHSSSSHRDQNHKHHSHRHHRDSDPDRHDRRSHKHEHSSRSDRHRSDDSRDRHKRRDRDRDRDEQHRSDRSKGSREHESDRKRSRLDA